MGYLVEPLAASHGRAVIDIYNHYTQNGFAAYFEQPLPYPAFHRFMEMSADYPAFAARAEGTGDVAGFALLRSWHPAPAFRRTAELTIFLHPAHTRRGLGRHLLDRLVAGARDLGIDTLLASISSRNPESLAFHQQQGFEPCGRFPAVGRKFGQDFDVVWMCKRI